ncbi:radical SAM family heme chaperone HemW [Cyclobacterium xiamenense]|uniref:radical SAM family heme chaperone HemW n=1 Tax=Cyclobacterium xiamenense TaxID=1297121 RepID=UPI0012B96D58|nr:radical SAM family heme chaperone HemW [Cyclobacterium xiamenense]
MAGIYVHIPFCLQACHYCDFHFSTNLKNTSDMVDAICRELVLRKSYLPAGSLIETLYFGGGTPSILPTEAIQKIWKTVQENFDCQLQEVTLEANPDDLEEEKLDAYLKMGIDRLSIGIQSFNEEVLRFYNRSHSAAESLTALQKARKAGFKSLSMDLIYGFPQPNHAIWKQDLAQALHEAPNHISAYCLTVEPKTALGVWEKKGKFNAASENFQAEQFEILQQTLSAKGYVAYEISNFAKEGAFSLHNSNYWKGVPYLGLGPAAHSFDGRNRGYNIASNPRYLRHLQAGQLPFSETKLSREDRINEYLLTSLRTIWGVQPDYLKKKYDWDLLTERKVILEDLRSRGMIHQQSDRVTLTESGKLLADYLAAKLFL